jgi:hypothetical protein
MDQRLYSYIFIACFLSMHYYVRGKLHFTPVSLGVASQHIHTIIPNIIGMYMVKSDR